jgi:hypothetical protein
MVLFSLCPSVDQSGGAFASLGQTVHDLLVVRRDMRGHARLRVNASELFQYRRCDSVDFGISK